MHRLSLLVLALSTLAACASEPEPGTVPTAGNRPPALATATFGDGPFTVGNDLIVRLGNATDPDGDSVTFSYAWSINGKPVAGVDGATLSKDRFKRGDRVVCSVTPSDGELDGEAVTTEEIVVGNVLPVMGGVSLGSGPFGVEDVITVTVESGTDADGDTITYTYRWFTDGNEVADHAEDTLTGDHFAKGQSVQVEVTPHDGIDAGLPMVSNAVAIVNTPPALASAGLDAAAYGKADTITAVPGAATAPTAIA